MYRRIGNCDNCGAPFATSPGEDFVCACCGGALPSPIDDVGLGKATLHQLLGEAFAREDWVTPLLLRDHLNDPEQGRMCFDLADRLASSG